MPTLRMSIEQTSVKNTETKQKWTINELQSGLLMPQALFDYDQIQADVHVSLQPDPSPGPITCEIDPNKKLVTFRTHRKEQELDLFLRPDKSLKGRVHFLRIEAANQSDKTKFGRVEYFVKHPTEPDIFIIDSVKFGDEIPVRAQQIRLVFSMNGKTRAFAYKIFVRDLQGSILGEECDPQASNEPPVIIGG